MQSTFEHGSASRSSRELNQAKRPRVPHADDLTGQVVAAMSVVTQATSGVAQIHLEKLNG
jgi:hypothetical protein